MSSNLTENAEKALENALHSAEEFGHTYIGSEHLLLALAEDRGSRAAEMLARCGIDSEKIRDAILDHSGSGENTKLTPRDMTPKFRRIIANALEIAINNGATQVDTEHILTAVYEGEDSIALKILHKLSYTPCAHDYMMLYLFGTNDGYDMYGYPTQKVDDPRAKSLERAIEYLPVFVDCLWATKLPDRGMERIFDRMERAGYSSQEVASLGRAWLETVERKKYVCEPLMMIYLFGKCELTLYDKEWILDLADKKDRARARAFVPAYVSWLSDVFTSCYVDNKDRYDPDPVLKRFVQQMQKNGYSDEDITDLATLWMQEMMNGGKAFYSLMYMRLFGEHFGGTRVDIDGVKDFDAALALIPEHLEYVFAYEGFDDEYAVKFDPDCELYKLVVKMREQGYCEARINAFVIQWVNRVEALQKPCNSPIYTYLFNWFFFKHENFKIELSQNKKDYGRALGFIPKWIEYLTDMSVQYHNGYGEHDVFDLLIYMNKEGYEKTRSEKLLDTFLAELHRLLPHEVKFLKINLLIYAEKEPWLKEFLPLFDSYEA